MHGREGENRKRSRHMWSVPTGGKTGTRTVAGESAAAEAKVDSFYKDTRKIRVGDCALFKPPHDCPPFVGIIRRLTFNKENILQLSVNWLYRPAEVKLGKGIQLEAAPNEVFYSFHEDEIPAASLLHPCKVSFLPKGVDLPSGVSSFVCRRVYDIANKCLWWLTDQNYIDERQEEVDKLLNKTRKEMHASAQPSRRSPKSVNGSTPTQPKHGSDNVVKGRKRDRSDQISDHVKREQTSKTDDFGSGQLKQESILRSEISKITDKGGLVDSVGVEKFVQLLQSDRAEKRMELISKSMLASVIAATEKFECLNLFVQLKGLSVLDGWLQDFHKGKIGDGGSKDGDKSIEDFLLVLLRALDKLPVNLQALQMCNIGKSVNHLRSHKNVEIQKKARILVDTWKKRVEAEMNSLDAKSGSTQASSWPSRSRVPEVSHGGNRHPGGSTDVATRSSVTQLSTSKSISIKAVQGEVSTKSASPPALMKAMLSPASGKDGQPKVMIGSTSDLPSTSAREDRSSSSSQSPNNCHSRSSDHVKAPILSRKEDARSSSAGSTGLKMSSGTSRPRGSVNCVSGHVPSASPRESGSSRTLSVHRNFVSDKLSPSGLTTEKPLDVPVGEGNNHKLIVKIPDRGRSPCQSASEGAVCEPSIKSSRPSSPVFSEKHDQSDHKGKKDKSDVNRLSATSDVNTESWQSNDFKDVFTASDEGDVSPSVNPVKEHGEANDVTTKLADGSKATSSSSNELRPGRTQVASFCSINAMVESCVKYSEVNVPDSEGDDVGMNLLASVAAGEICDSELIAPTGSPNKSTVTMAGSCKAGDTKLKSSGGSSLTQDPKQNADCTVADRDKQGVILSFRDGSYHPPKEASGDFSGDRKTTLVPENTPVVVGEEFNISKVDLQSAVDRTLGDNQSADEHRGASSVSVFHTTAMGKVLDAGENKQLDDKTESLAGAVAAGNNIHDAKIVQRSSPKTDNKVVNEAEGTPSYVSSEVVGHNKADAKEECNGSNLPENKPPAAKVHAGHLNGSEEDRLHHTSSTKDLPSKSINEPNSGVLNEMDTKSCGGFGKQNDDNGTNGYPANRNLVTASCSSVSEQKSEAMKPTIGSASPREASCAVQEVEQDTRSRVHKMTGVEAEGEKCTSLEADTPRYPASGASVMDTKPKFDLNEGFDADDGKYESSCPPPAITVAAAAKGPFVPPEDLFRSNGQFGWKGSAATSAFRPAAPRRVPETSQAGASVSHSEATSGKHGRNLLDFDLNVPDERILEDMASRNTTQETASTSDQLQVGNLGRNGPMGSTAVRSSGVLDFDLNRTDEASDIGQHPSSSSHRLEVPFMPVKTPSSGGFLISEVKRDFDLNSGPGLDDSSIEPLSSFHQHFKSSMQPPPSVAGFGITNAEMGTFSSWFPSGHARPPAVMPSILSDREQPFPIVATGGQPRILGPHTGGTSFSTDVYRGSVLSSSPAVPFPSAPFQYSIFPFGTSYSLPSATFGGAANHADALSGGRLGFPIVNSQLIGPSPTVSSQFPRPNVVSLSEGGNSVVADGSRTWARHGLDLNAGPGSVDMVGREENVPLSLRQLSVASSQGLTEEQARMFQQVAGGLLKRKEPDGGWGSESFRHKQSSWQ